MGELKFLKIKELFQFPSTTDNGEQPVALRLSRGTL
jgi:hypothetical protein